VRAEGACPRRAVHLVAVAAVCSALAHGCRRQQPATSLDGDPSLTSPLAKSADTSSMPPPAPPPGESAPAVKLQATRPPNVPQAAVWVGGPDGGVFVLFEPPPIPGAKATTIRGKVFHSTGEVWFSGTFVPEPPGAAVDLMRMQGAISPEEMGPKRSRIVKSSDTTGPDVV
jgi:hypothetical protein